MDTKNICVFFIFHLLKIPLSFIKYCKICMIIVEYKKIFLDIYNTLRNIENKTELKLSSFSYFLTAERFTYYRDHNSQS